MKLLSLILVSFAIAVSPPTAFAATILGTGTASLLGSDLTDPENNGSDSTAAGTGFNWLTIGANQEAYFSPGGGSEGSFDIFDNKVGAGEAKYCCGGPVWNVTVRLVEPYVLTHFTIASTNDAPGRDPDVWQLQGSPDGATWSTIYSYDHDDPAAPGNFGYIGNSPFTSRYQVIRFDGGGVDYPTPAAHAWFRLNVDSSAGWAGAGGQASLGELELFGTVIPEPSAPALVSLAGLGFALLRCRKK